MPPLALVSPVPSMVEPVHVKRPVTVMLPVPAKVPPLRVSAVVVALALKLAVPPVMVVVVLPVTS